MTEQVGACWMRLDSAGLISPAEPCSFPELEVDVVGNDQIRKLTEHWANRLGSYRAGDAVDMSTLLAVDVGTAILSSALHDYFEKWGRSDWLDADEIEFLAIELARLWPRNKEIPVIAELSARNAKSAKDIFIKAFVDEHTKPRDPTLSEALAASAA